MQFLSLSLLYFSNIPFANDKYNKVEEYLVLSKEIREIFLRKSKSDKIYSLIFEDIMVPGSLSHFMTLSVNESS